MKNIDVLGTIKELVVLVIMCLLFYWACWVECHYSRDCVVVKIDNASDSILVEDSSNHYWEFVGDGYEIGQVVRVTFYTNHTDTDIIDDEIVDVR